jgi:hypothetical protein
LHQTWTILQKETLGFRSQSDALSYRRHSIPLMYWSSNIYNLQLPIYNLQSLSFSYRRLTSTIHLVVFKYLQFKITNLQFAISPNSLLPFFIMSPHKPHPSIGLQIFTITNLQFTISVNSLLPIIKLSPHQHLTP